MDLALVMIKKDEINVLSAGNNCLGLGQGYGALGFIFAKDYYRAHNGKFMQDTHDEGSVFYFSLPKRINFYIKFYNHFFQKNLEDIL